MSTLTTRRAAQALGVSESSLKRWCDQGLIEVVRTAGGHRRLEPQAVVEYARSVGHPIVRPQLLGLLKIATPGAGKTESSAQALAGEMLRGDDAGCRFVAQSSLLPGQRIAAFGDRFVAAAFQEIGERWAHGSAQVYQERRACQICQATLAEMGQLLPVHSRGPVAIGGTLVGDPYTLPTMLAALVLRQNGWRAQSLGSELPWDTFVKAIQDIRPRLFWLSVSTMPDAATFVAEYQKFHAQIPDKTAVVVGGRALVPEIRTQLQYAAYCDNLQHLESVASSLFRQRRSRRQGD